MDRSYSFAPVLCALLSVLSCVPVTDQQRSTARHSPMIPATADGDLDGLLLAGEEPSYMFDGAISRRVLENYLARAVTHTGLCASSSEPATRTLKDDIRMLKNIGAKFVGRAAFAWHLPADEEQHFKQTKAAARQVHRADPEIILQACVFEIVSRRVERIAVPRWAFEAFGVPPVTRNFDYNAMLYANGQMHDHWRPGASVPDMSQLETRLWFYYRARRYIDCGLEAIHFGQVMIMDDADPGHRHWIDMLTKVRKYARTYARRHFVLCDAHTHGEVEEGRLLFDFHSFPLRIKMVEDKPQQAVLAMGHGSSLFGRSAGGITPSGWSCESLPYLVEFDNWGYSGKGGQAVRGIWVWGYDEISWFAKQNEQYRNDWLRYARQWIRAHDTNGYLQMPTRRIISGPIKPGIRTYVGNTRSQACPTGWSVEQTIKEIWSARLPVSPSPKSLPRNRVP